MEITSSALTGVLRVGIQVIIARRRPVLEIYQNLHNNFGPPIEFSTRLNTSRREKHRFQDIFVDLTLINIGGVRAENVTFELTGNFKREGSRENPPELFKSKMRQLAPGQAIYLMRIENHDLQIYAGEKEGDNSVMRSVGIKSDTLTICAHYDGPSNIVNRLLRWPRRWRGLKQYALRFTFDPQVVVGDLPPAQYA
jgi:hypothetical protein